MSEESSSSKLDNFSKEELIKLIKKYVILQKQLKTKNEDLTNKLNEQSTQSFTLDHLNNTNKKLEEENFELKSQIQLLNKQIEDLSRLTHEYESFRAEQEPLLENARREIELNKSILDMLNNEIQILNSEKLKLEKRLFITRRNTPPSVIIEEDEDDLEEERNQHHVQPCQVHKLNPIQEEEQTQLNNDVAYIKHIETNNINSDGILILNKQIEDLTFYVDELKSELEAERERNNEYLNEIKEYRKQIEEFEEQHEFNSNELRLENDRLQKECVDALLRVSEKEKQITDLICSSQQQNFSVNTVEPSSQTISNRIDKFLTIFISEIIEKQNYDFEFKTFDSFDQNELDQINDMITKLKSTDNCNRIKSFEAQMERIIKDFKEEISSLDIKLTDKQTEFNNYKQQTDTKINTLQSELDSEKEKFKNNHAKFERFEKEASKNKVLDLEIADYERSIKALNIQLITKDKEINDLKSDLNIKNEKCNKIKLDYESLVKEKEQTDEKCTKLKQLLVKAKKDVSDAKAHEAEHLSNDVQVKAQLETSYLEIENQKLQLTELTIEKQRVQDRLQTNNELNQRTIQSLEHKIKQSETQVIETNDLLESLKTEYENYKQKVQHAFKKQKELNENNMNSSTVNESQKYLAEIEQLKELVSNLKQKLEEQTEKIKLLDKENELIQDEYAKSLERNTKLLTELKEKETEWRSKNQELANDNSSKSDETFQTIRNLQTEKEAQANTFKDKLKQLNYQNMQTISILQAQLEESKEEIDKLNKQFTELKNMDMTSNQIIGSSSPLNVSITSLSSQVNTLSPSIKLNDFSESNNKPTNKTFEQLLNEPAAPANTPSINPFDSKAILGQIEQFKNELNKAKLQLEHLNELLNESELNNARLTEQINLLKDEIRRLERNQEREKSISNMEYLKNVVYKFLTFTNQQEKAQLLPVLSTMLKLSQEEQHEIMSVKASTANGEGWATYLPKWTT